MNTNLETDSDVDQSLKGNTMIPHQSIPNEIISLIFKHFPAEQERILFQCTLINRQFSINATRLLWEKLEFRNHQESERFLSLLRNGTLSNQHSWTPGQLTQSLVLANPAWKGSDLKQLLSYLPNLEYLKIDGRSYITNEDFQHVARYCQQLTTLELHLYQMDSGVSFAAIGKYCHQLEHLQWDMAGKGSVALLSSLEGCPKLERLTILDSDGTELMQDKAIRAIQQLPHLKHLTLGGSWTCQLTESLLLYPTTGTWPQLQHLTLDSYKHIDDATLIDFIQHYPTLQHLELCRSARKQSVDTILDDMAPWLPNLKSLNLNGNDVGVPYRSVHRLIKQCPHLNLIGIGYGGRYVGSTKLFSVNNNGNETRFRATLNSRQIDKIRQIE